MLTGHRKLLAAIFVALIPLLLYQHCGNYGGQSPVRFNKIFPAVSSMGGNGGGYEGKPSDGKWVRINPNVDCQNSSDHQALIKIEDRKPVLIDDNCENKNFTFSLSDSSLSFQFYNPNFFTFGGAIFEKLKTEAAPQMSESFCRSVNSTYGIDIVIQSDLTSKSLSARVVKGIFSSGEILYVNYDFVSKSTNNSETIFRSDDDSLQLKIQGTPQEYKNLSGVLTTHIDGNLKDFPVVCQKMSEKPVLSVDVNGLAAYWKFDQSALFDGGTVIDSKGYAPGLISTGDNSNKLVAGISGQALHFDGINDYVDMGANVLNMGTQDFSVSLWIKNVTSSTALQVLGDRTDLGGPRAGWNIMQSQNDFDPRISDGNDTINGAFATLPINPSGFQHLVAVYDRTNQVIRTYVNGQLVKTVSSSQVPGSVTYNGSFVLGASSSTIKNYFFLGDLDEISIWNRALTPTDIQALYKNVFIY